MKLMSMLLVLLMFSACGYTPSAKFSREVVGESISTSVKISPIDPENTVIIKDAVDSAIIEVFHASLTDKSNSQTHLAISLSNVSYTPVQYDKNGFVISYRATTSLEIVRTTNGESKNYRTRGTYDFSIDPNSIITDRQRYIAIKGSSAKAIRSFVAQVSAEGAREKKGQKQEE